MEHCNALLQTCHRTPTSIERCKTSIILQHMRFACHHHAVQLLGPALTCVTSMQLLMTYPSTNMLHHLEPTASKGYAPHVTWHKEPQGSQGPQRSQGPQGSQRSMDSIGPEVPAPAQRL
jgi:hypothetical protein